MTQQVKTVKLSGFNSQEEVRAAAQQLMSDYESQLRDKYGDNAQITIKGKAKVKAVAKPGSTTNGGTTSTDGGYSTDGSTTGGSSSSNEFNSHDYDKYRLNVKNMKDSNIRYISKPNDIWNKFMEKKSKDFNNLTTEMFLYTFHDEQRHEYLTSITIDCDKNDIVTTAQVSFRYDKRLMEYWIPGKTTFAIIGGTYDREILFVGRTSEVNQRGSEIEMVGQNIGWKFKMYMTTKFEKTLYKQPVKDVVKMIFKQLGFEKGKYHIDLTGIPNLNDYVLDENCTIVKGGKTVQNVPELTDVVKNLQQYNIDKYAAKKAQTHETQEVADQYNSIMKEQSILQVVDNKKAHSIASIRENYGVTTTVSDKEEKLIFSPTMDRIKGTQDLKDFLVKGYAADSEYTFEDVLHNIASAIDAHFFIIDTTVCFMSFNALFANSNLVQKAVNPRIDFWQLQDDSYELNVNQYGYYNTVIVEYKNGKIEKSYDDLVRIYGRIPIKYKEPKLDYYGAQLKAQAYLSAHIRDFGMELHATILHSGKYTVSSFVKLKNPLTMSEGLFYIYGTSVQWSADNQPLTCDLDLRFGPNNPDDPEVPEVGASYSSSGSGGGGNGSTASANVSGNIAQAAREITAGCVTEDDKAFAIYDWVDKYVKYDFYEGSRYSPTTMLSRKMGNCWDTAYLIYELCSAVGVKCEVWNGYYQFLDGTYGHLWNKIYYQGKMTFADTGYGSTGQIKRNPIGSYHGGKILSASLQEKNY